MWIKKIPSVSDVDDLVHGSGPRYACDPVHRVVESVVVDWVVDVVDVDPYICSVERIKDLWSITIENLVLVIHCHVVMQNFAVYLSFKSLDKLKFDLNL